MVASIGDVQIFTIEEILSGEVDEIISNVCGVGTAFAFLSPEKALKKAYLRAEAEIRQVAFYSEADVVLAVKVNVSSNMFPGPFFLRQNVLLVGTAVTIKK